MGKVFGIGLSKTGTTSLARALMLLGLKGVDHPSPEALAAFLRGHLDFGTDMPFSTRFRDFDRRFPGSRFILTIRPDLPSWLRSVEHQHMKMPLEQAPPWAADLRMEQYGRLDYDECNQYAVHAAHHVAVLDHFRRRPDDLLVMNVFDGDGWDVLCPFVGKPVPAEPFPHLNRSGPPT